MAEILVTEIRARRLSAAGHFFVGVRRGVTPCSLYFSPVRVPRQFARRFNDLSCISTPRRPLIRLFFFSDFFFQGRKHSARISDGSDCSAHCFFHCFPLFLRRRVFSSLRKALHCSWRAFSIVDRLYFFRKNFPSARDAQ